MGRFVARSVAVVITCIAAPVARAGEGATGAAPAEKTFHLNQYMNGTPSAIRRTLQGPVDEFTAKTKDAKRRVADCEADLAAAREAALARARESDRYRDLATAARQAESDLAEARRAGTVRQRLDAGTKLNQLRSAMEKIERSAAAADRDVPIREARLAEERQSVSRCEQSLKKATDWRDKWVYAIECTFRMRAPLRVGREGALTTVKVLRPDQPGHEGVLVEYEAPQLQSNGGESEGIRTVNVVMRKKRLLLAPSTPGAKSAKAGDVLPIYRNYRIEGITTDEDGVIYIAARHPADPDDLLAAMIPLRGK
jgi:hypothetical protein